MHPTKLNCYASFSDQQIALLRDIYIPQMLVNYASASYNTTEINVIMELTEAVYEQPRGKWIARIKSNDQILKETDSDLDNITFSFPEQWDTITIDFYHNDILASPTIFIRQNSDR
jgi:hypothetical protein